MTHPKTSFVFFGTPAFAVRVLEELEKAGFLPSLVVTAPDKKAGRGLNLVPPPVKTWAEAHSIPLFQPEKLDSSFIRQLSPVHSQLFVVAAYGKILPKNILDMPTRGALNVHPSLLPKYRGASPVEAAILAGDKTTGVTIMLLDEHVDHGPIVAQEYLSIPGAAEALALEDTLARQGGALLARSLTPWISGDLRAAPQDDTQATYTKKIRKEDGLLDLAAPPEMNERKVRAYAGWPGAYMWGERHGKKMRVRVTRARAENGAFVIEKVVPEGKKEMNYTDFLRGQKIY